MGYDRDKPWHVLGVGRQAGPRNWLRHWLEVADGDIAFRVVVMTAGMLSSVAIAFGLLSS
ncbi:hypothetical protein FBZ93_114137 [Bradyrhizobium macuxiense]|uniref:Uncharacterized protein n=1 Tax=Bradyrhizobium macuxiense TaxID=1755647 RepID=A0A560L800_9BRAD|nr:hypothetical protein [Bradyrhizobium macuxiense]TWB90584.1 hypothetical protein FBZ93_114137 [Bradyrhizobium macuxiense]